MRPEDRKHFSLATTFVRFGVLLRRRRLLGLLLCASFPVGAMFAFLSAGPFVFVDIYGMKATHLSYLLASTVLAMSAFAMLNTRLVKRFGLTTMMRSGLGLQALFCLVLVATVAFSLGPVVLATAAVLLIGAQGLTSANAVAASMQEAPDAAGTVSSLSGTMRFGFGALASMLVAALPTSVGTLGLSMAVCGLLAGASYWFLARPPRVSA